MRPGFNSEFATAWLEKMSDKSILYSSILIDFIEPLITGDEDEHEFLDKAMLGQIAWNFSVSDTNDLPFDAIHKQIFNEIASTNSEVKEILNKLVLRRVMKFSQFNQFIFKVEIRENKLGQKTLYVESAPADKII